MGFIVGWQSAHRNHAWRRIWIGIVGSTVILIGVALLVLPGPGLLIIAGGLAILATEFAWARVALRRTRKVAERVGERTGLLARWRDWRRARRDSDATR